MATTDGHDTVAQQAHFCTNCGTQTGDARFCPDCGTPTSNGGSSDAVAAPASGPTQPLVANTTAPYEATTTTEFPPQAQLGQNVTGASGTPPSAPGGRTPRRGGAPRSHMALILAAAGLGLVAIAVAVIIFATGSSNSGTRVNPNAAYRQKLATALAPVLAANTSLSNNLTNLSGADTTSAKSALSQAEQAVTAARGAVGVLSVPQLSSQLSQQVQQALTQENGYLQAVGATLATQSQGNISQVRPLATSASSALVPLNAVASGIGSSLGGSDQLISWANGRAAAAAKAANNKKAAKKPASSTSSSPSGSSSTTSSAPASQGTDCGGGLHAGPNTSCPFAFNVQQAWEQAPAGVDTLQVFSPVTDQVYTMTCTQAGVGIACTGANNASVSW